MRPEVTHDAARWPQARRWMYLNREIRVFFLVFFLLYIYIYVYKEA